MSVFRIASCRLTAILTFLCAAFGLILVVELLDAAPASKDGSSPPRGSMTPSDTPAAAAATFSLPPLRSFAVVTERPLFSPSREREQLPNGDSNAWSSFILAGIIISPDLREAMVLHSRPPTLVHIKEGDAIDGWTLANVFPDHAVFRNGDAQHELKLNAKSNDRAPIAAGPHQPVPRS